MDPYTIQTLQEMFSMLLTCLPCRSAHVLSDFSQPPFPPCSPPSLLASHVLLFWNPFFLLIFLILYLAFSPYPLLNFCSNKTLRMKNMLKVARMLYAADTGKIWLLGSPRTSLKKNMESRQECGGCDGVVVLFFKNKEAGHESTSISQHSFKNRGSI